MIAGCINSASSINTRKESYRHVVCGNSIKSSMTISQLCKNRLHFNFIKGTVMQTENALANDCLRV